MGTGTNGPPMAVTTSPAMPLPPIPSTSTLSISSPAGSPATDAAASTLDATCSGNARAKPNMSRESVRWSSTNPAIAPSGLERGLDALCVGLGEQPVVLGVVDGLGLVDQHDRDVVTDGVAPLEAGVVERVLVGEVEQRSLVLRTGQDLEELGIEGHRRFSPS